ncbi:hypothetical protein RI129_000220 [Pyrocoelia pectoralis]|uniref:Uncharacterized protein n=1 Tax=Pyrocoelia pectoralis TaxID=417401 RepID=A0AAN7ZVF8_9COLE
MPQIPNKRSASRQSSVNDTEAHEGYCTPENTSHRGASLPPTPTKTQKVLARIAANTKSLPPTPGRKLPQPNLNHRSAKTRRNNLMKRTNSADYADYSNEDVSDNAYIRQGAISAREMYNEDYNYAYQSIDNLTAQQQEELNVTSAIDCSDYNRTSVAEGDLPLEDEELNDKHEYLKEEIDEKPVRPQVTAQQRWHWAYNKIIMQLNVSTFSVLLYVRFFLFISGVIRPHSFIIRSRRSSNETQ